MRRSFLPTHGFCYSDACPRPWQAQLRYLTCLPTYFLLPVSPFLSSPPKVPDLLLVSSTFAILASALHLAFDSHVHRSNRIYPSVYWARVWECGETVYVVGSCHFRDTSFRHPSSLRPLRSTRDVVLTHLYSQARHGIRQAGLRRPSVSTEEMTSKVNNAASLSKYPDYCRTAVMEKSGLLYIVVGPLPTTSTGRGLYWFVGSTSCAHCLCCFVQEPPSLLLRPWKVWHRATGGTLSHPTSLHRYLWTSTLLGVDLLTVIFIGHLPNQATRYCVSAHAHHNSSPRIHTHLEAGCNP